MRILIVDDEEAIHEQLSNEIPWIESGWEIVGHAYDGEEASQLTKQLQPDIIITDIKMPLTDGLRFMEWLKTFLFRGKVIVLSGYGDFQYIRPAFLLDALDYLLKPVKLAEIVMAISKAENEIKKETKYMVEQIQEQVTLNNGLVLMRDEFLSEIVSGVIVDENEMIVRGEELCLSIPEEAYNLIVLKLIDFDQVVQQKYNGNLYICYYAIRNIVEECMRSGEGLTFRFLKNSNEFVLVCPTEKNSAFNIGTFTSSLVDALHTYLSINSFIGISKRKQRLGAISVAYQEANSAIDAIKLQSKDQIKHFKQGILEDEKNRSVEWEEVYELFECLVNEKSLYSGQDLLKKLEFVMGEAVLSKMNGNQLKKAVNRIMNIIQQTPDQSIDLSYQINELKISLAELQINNIKKVLLDLVEVLIGHVKEDTKTYSSEELIEVTKEYVENHYKSVNLDEISTRFFVNKNYYCTLFKNITGETFSNYLTEVRMKKAMLLLVNSDLKTYEISDKVGYRDQRYFSQVFKRKVGLKPTQYRMKHR